MEKHSAKKKKRGKCRGEKVTLMTGIFCLAVNQLSPSWCFRFKRRLLGSLLEHDNGIASGACRAPRPAGCLRLAAVLCQAAGSAKVGQGEGSSLGEGTEVMG